MKNFANLLMKSCLAFRREAKLAKYAAKVNNERKTGQDGIRSNFKRDSMCPKLVSLALV